MVHVEVIIMIIRLIVMTNDNGHICQYCFDDADDDDVGDVLSGDDNDVDENDNDVDDDDDDDDDNDDDDWYDLKTCIDRANNCFMIHSKHFSLKKMRTSIDVKFRPSFACFSTNSGYKRMFSLSDILQIAVAIC